ncbi:MAG: Sporulation thiol-disulfide oxidoreductase A [Candidatus Marinimicrobia bacterium]|nr:Sporulation thiol-disulfide oxidoreductase A [Candidatus Neomarinimicrobiota bacterium]
MSLVAKVIPITILFLLLVSPGTAQTDSTLVDSTRQAPTFFLKTLEGEPFFLSRHVGDRAKPRMKQPVVLSFFATWCIPCRAEIPKLHEIREEFPGVKIMLIDVNEKPDTVSAFVEEMDFTLPVLMDLYGVVAKKYGVIGSDNLARLPSLAIIDSDGELSYFHQGYEKGDEEKVREILTNLVPDD